MHARLRTVALAFCAFLAQGATGYAQQIAFTSRNYVTSPLAILSSDSSKEYGFETVTLRNDSPKAIAGVRFEIVLRTDEGDEIADERHFTVNLDAHDAKRMAIGLADIRSLQQQAESHHQRWALAILTIEAVEFSDGGEWKQSEREQGAPIDPLLVPQPELKQRKK